MKQINHKKEGKSLVLKEHMDKVRIKDETDKTK